MISIENIDRVYSGKDGKCCCGCSGKYWDDAKQKARVIKIMNKTANLTDGGCHAYAVVGERLYIAYYKK
jgi:hypothetical protein